MWLIKKDKEVAEPAADEKSAAHLEDQPPLTTTLSRNQRLRHHLIRFWIWYTVGSVVFLAIFLPIFFKICIPAISQRVVEDTPLTVNKAQLLDPTPETLTVSLDTTLDIPLKATTIDTEPFSLGLFNRATKPMQPYLDLSLPKYKLRGTSNMQISNKDCQIASQEELIRVLSNALHSTEFKLSALGSTMAHLGALNAHITLDKNINLVGLDDLRNWGIQTIGILSQPEEDGTNVRGTVNLPNHSVVEFTLGNVTFNLYSGNLNIGLVHVDNAFLASGDNSFPIYGYLNLTTVLDNFRDIFAAQKQYISSGDLLLSVSGNTVMYNGQHLPYYEEVFQNSNLSTQLPVSRILKGTLNGIQDGGQGGIQGLLKQLNLNLTSLSELSDLPGMSGLSSLGNNS